MPTRAAASGFCVRIRTPRPIRDRNSPPTTSASRIVAVMMAPLLSAVTTVPPTVNLPWPKMAGSAFESGPNIACRTFVPRKLSASVPINVRISALSFPSSGRKTLRQMRRPAAAPTAIPASTTANGFDETCSAINQAP